MNTSLIESIKQTFLENNEEFNDSRYNVDIRYALPKTQTTAVQTCLSKSKFSGRHGQISDIANVVLFKIVVYDTTIPVKTNTNNIVYSDNITMASVQTWVEIPDLIDYINQQVEALAADRQIRAVLGSRTENSTQKCKISEQYFPLTVPAALGKWSKADKQFFKWWARDDHGNIYLRHNGQLILVPLREGETLSIKQDSQFWATFWLHHRDEIIKKTKASIDLFWKLRESPEAVQLSEEDLRTKSLSEEAGKISIIEAMHTIWPKSIMNRASVRETYKTYGSGDDEQTVFDSCAIVLRPGGKDNEGPQTDSEENWQKILAYAVPLIPKDELEEAKNFSNKPGELAIHTVQIDRYKNDSKDIPELPSEWAAFFENRLGENTSSQLYRIAKWVVGCLDENNYSRQVLVVSGRGKDGKSIFSQVMRKGFNNIAGNTNFAKILPPQCVDAGNTQNGLLECMNSRVLFANDVSKVTTFVRTEVIKNITGRDPVTADVKYRQPVIRDMSGTKIMLLTNFTTYLADSFVDSRVNPIFFQRKDLSEADWNPREIEAKLLSQFDEWITWCFTFARIQDEALGNRSDEAIVWSDNAPQDDIKAQWENIGTNSFGEPMFKYRAIDEKDEDDTEMLCSLLNEVTTSGGTCKNFDLRSALICAADAAGLRSLSATIGDSRSPRLLARAVHEVYPEASSFQSNGKRGWKGFSIKPKDKTPAFKSRRASNLETQVPAT